jgi:hypothetical protein
MKLLKYQKEAIVRSIMNDVPEVDYQELIQKEVTAWAVERLPANIKRIWDAPDSRSYLRTERYYFERAFIEAPGYWHTAANEDTDDAKALRAKISELKALEDAQDQARSELRSKVFAVVMSCNTHKQFIERLPEFEEYLPAEAAPSTNLPVVANIVANLTKAGWPKGKTS